MAWFQLRTSFLLLLLLCCVSLREAAKGKTCKPSRCGLNNLACYQEQTAVKSCRDDVKMISMSKHIAVILNIFNGFRNASAAGYSRTLYPAARMARMSWSEELTYLSKLNVMRCATNYRPCISTAKFPYIGYISELFPYGGSEDIHSDSELVRSLAEGWLQDALSVTRQHVMSVPEELPFRHTVRAMLMMMDRNTHVGCAAMRYRVQSFNFFRLLCSFSTDVGINRPIYKLARTPGERCKRRDKIYKNLCSTSERYVYNEKDYKYGVLAEMDE